MNHDESRHMPAPAADSLGNLVLLTHVIYGLHAFAVVTGVATSATVIGSFIASLPSIVAVILNYLKRSAVRGTWLEGHFRWQIRTFWFAVLWVAVAILMAFTLIGIPLALAVLAGAALWIIYRVARGWWSLSQRRTMPSPPPPL